MQPLRIDRFCVPIGFSDDFLYGAEKHYRGLTQEQVYDAFRRARANYPARHRAWEHRRRQAFWAKLRHHEKTLPRRQKQGIADHMHMYGRINKPAPALKPRHFRPVRRRQVGLRVRVGFVSTAFGLAFGYQVTPVSTKPVRQGTVLEHLITFHQPFNRLEFSRLGLTETFAEVKAEVKKGVWRNPRKPRKKPRKGA